MPFEKPAAFEGSQAELLDRGRVVRDQIDARLHDWFAELSAIHEALAVTNCGAHRTFRQ